MIDTINIKEIIEESKEKTSDNLMECIIIAIVLWLITVIAAIINLIPIIGWIAYIFIASGLQVGFISCYIKISRGEQFDVNDLFSKMKIKTMFTATIITLLVGLIVGFGMMLLIIPGIIFALMYSFPLYIVSDNEDAGIITTMKQSSQMMKGHKGKLFNLILSIILKYIGLVLLGILGVGFLGSITSEGMAFLLIIVYFLVIFVFAICFQIQMMVAMAIFYNKLKESQIESDQPLN